MDTPQVLLDHHLKTLRLPTFLREYDKVAQQCAAEGVDFPRYLLRLSELELLDRERRATERRIRQAKFDVVKSLDTFDFLAIPSLNKSLVLDLARCEFVERKENVLALGNSGTGKTHIALALGLAACQKGFRVRFTTAASLAHELIEAKDERRLMRFQKMLSSFELLIIDELGFVPLSKTGAELLFEVFSRRYERSATLVTSNLPFNEWTEAFGSRAADRSPAGPAHPPRPHPGDERGKLPAQRQQAKPPREASLLVTRSFTAPICEGRLPLRPKRAPQSGSQAYAPAAPANPSNQSTNPTCELVYFPSAPMV